MFPLPPPPENAYFIIYLFMYFSNVSVKNIVASVPIKLLILPSIPMRNKLTHN